MAEVLEQLRIWIEQIILALGYPGIALVMLIENLFPPIPSELVMPFAGFMVAQNQFNFVGIVIAGTVGSVLGAVVLYYVGMLAGEPLIRSFLRRYGRWFALSEHDLDRALQFFSRYGEAVVFFGRLIPLVRSLISLPAGMHRMPMSKFLLFTTLGSTIWTGVLGYAGFILGANWAQVLEFISTYQKATLVVLGLLVAVLVIRWMFRFSNRINMPRMSKDSE